MKYSEKLKRTAGEWWVSTFNSPKDNGDPESGLAMMIATVLTQNSVSNEQIEKFVQCTINKITELEKNNHGLPIVLASDYGPDHDLMEIFKAAEINPNICPYKTAMYIEDGSIFVKNGYGAPKVKIYEEKKENKENG